MKNNILPIFVAAISISAIANLQADEATPPPAASQVQTHLRVNLNDKVKEVHFINTNADNDVFTKGYVLKHADPYEIRPYLLAAVGGIPGRETGRRIDGNATKVECIKFLDGTGIVIVSAEDYRFEKDGNTNGMSIDEIIAALDKPANTAERGDVMRLFFPQYRSAAEIAYNLRRVGINVSGFPASTNWELDQGSSHARVDKELNALMLNHPHFAGKQVDAMLAQYDRPNPEVRIRYTVYEYDNETDAMVGSDFQAWKNGPGTDLFSSGMRLTQGWDVANMNVAQGNNIGSNTAKFLNFNPKWNTRYLDFLETRGLAKIITSGSISVYTGKVGIVESTIGIPIIKDGASRDPVGVTSITTTGPISTDGTTGTTGTGLKIENAITRSNVPINSTVFGAGVTANFRFWAYEVTSYNGNGSKVVDYYYEIDSDVPVLNANGESLGTHLIVIPAVAQTQVSLSQWNPDALAESGLSAGAYAAVPLSATQSEPTAFAIQNAPTRLSSVVSLGEKDQAYGFSLRLGTNSDKSGITVCADTTTLPIEVSNTSLVGFKSNGSPRTMSSKYATVLQVNNQGERFVIGGIEKQQRLSSATKIPFLGDIPPFGWLLGNNRETLKKTHIVAIVDVIPVMPSSPIPSEIKQQIEKLKPALNKENISYGYDQRGIDPDKNGFSTLP